ncbi:MAG: multidrug efflux SMR transporter [Methanomassiliicoccales archaeon]|jgi:quaternary ammonium compound-resistance protein SugE
MSENADAQDKNKGWLFLILAGALEPIWVVSMKLSEGFTQVIWAASTFIFLFGSMYFLAQALRSKIPMGTAYSIWVGVGAVGALIAGIILFDESSEAIRLGFVLLIIVGIVGLQATSGGEAA